MDMTARFLPVVAVVLAALALPASGASDVSSGALPLRGVLVPGESLGGIRLGDTPAGVVARWGAGHTRCDLCRATTWLFSYRGTIGSGAAVTFRRGRVVAVFTIGVPRGWRTTRGVRLGDPTENVLRTYRSLHWRPCIGYGALSIHHPRAVTSVFTYGEYVYGFALTHVSEPVCQ
jgi:hypothetical protein